MTDLKLNSECLVILAGSPRGGEKTWKSLNKNVLLPLKADLAICTDIWEEDNLLGDLAKYKWIIERFDNYETYYENNFTGTWKQYFDTGKKTGLYSSGLIHFLFKDIVKNNYMSILNNYKFIIYSRFDQYYLDKHPELDEDKILIPKGEDYYGICDRHAAVPVKFISEFLDICNYIDSKEAIKEAPKFNNCETTFLNHLISRDLIKNVKRTDRIQFTSSLKHEKTNWRIPKYKIYFFKDLMIKYPDEYIDGVKNSLIKNSFLNYFFKEPVITLNYFYLKLRRALGKTKRRTL